MTYVELIVVMSIFGVMSSIVLFNYGKFQANVDIRNLSNEIAIKIVEAQKSALSGKIVSQALSLTSWKPSYGVYFNLTTLVNPTKFIYFTDLNNDNLYLDPGCTGECLDSPTMTKGNSILTSPASGLNVFYQGDLNPYSLNDLTVTFTRPNSGAIIKSTQIDLSKVISYAQITITSPSGPSAKIKVYASGRIQIN